MYRHRWQAEWDYWTAMQRLGYNSCLRRSPFIILHSSFILPSAPFPPLESIRPKVKCGERGGTLARNTVLTRASDPRGPVSGANRLLRDGSRNNHADGGRCAVSVWRSTSVFWRFMLCLQRLGTSRCSSDGQSIQSCFIFRPPAPESHRPRARDAATLKRFLKKLCRIFQGMGV